MCLKQYKTTFLTFQYLTVHEEGYLDNFALTTMPWLTVMEYLCHK